MMRTRHKQIGLTMIEMLIATVISAILLGGVIQLFMGTRQTFRFYESAARLQEDGRFALEAMANDIKIAGLNLEKDRPAIQDVGNGFTVQWINSSDTLCRQDPVGQSRCTKTYAVNTRAAGSPPVTCTAAGTSLELNNNNGQGFQELVEAVEAMQVSYGECTDTKDLKNPKGDGFTDQPPGSYVLAAGVTDWNSVCSVRIDLLMVSLDDNIVEEPQVYQFPISNPAPTGAVDRCFHQSFSTTVAIRNRMPHQVP